MSRNNTVRFCQNNQAAASDATISVSGYKTGFPASNAVDPKRSLVWITKGAFRITSANKKIYINDGSDKTITLTEATYETGSALASHIQTQLNASSSNWTVSYSSSTYKFTIGRSSGTALLKLATTTDAAWDMLGYTGAIDDDVGTGQAADAIRIHTSERFRVSFAAAKQILAFFAIGNGNEEFDISSAATMTLKGDNIESLLDGGLSEVNVSLTRESTGIFKFIDDLANTTLRYWEFEFSDRENPNGPEFTFSQIYLGDYISPASRSISNGFERVLVDPSIRFVTEGQAEFVKTKRKYWLFQSAVVEELSDSDRTEIERLVYEQGTHTPFFVSIDPLAQISASVGEMTKYVRFDEDTEITHRQYKYFAVRLRMKEVIR